MSLELIPTQKGGSKLVYMDNMYHKRRYSPDRTKIYWSCVRIPEGCKGSLVTTSDYKDPKRGKATIKGLRLDAAEVSKTLRQANLGMPPAKRKLRPALASLHQRQQHLCQRYGGGNMAILEFLETAGKNIRIGRA